MNFPISSTIWIAILGAILLYSYYHFSQKFPNVIESLWGTIKGKTRKFYYYSIGFCFLCYFAIFYYLFQYNHFTSSHIYQITLAISVMIIASMLWMPTSIEYHFHPHWILRTLIIFILLVVALSAWYLVHILLQIKDNSFAHKLAVFGASYFFFQVFILDFLYWNYAYLFAS